MVHLPLTFKLIKQPISFQKLHECCRKFIAIQADYYEGQEVNQFIYIYIYIFFFFIPSPYFLEFLNLVLFGANNFQ